MCEEWKEDPELPGYEFSSLCRFKLKNGLISNISTSDDGYVKIKLTNLESNKISISLHRIIAKLFVLNDNIKDNIEVDHINSIRYDNRAINLLWVTRSENNTNKTFKNDTNSTKRPVYQYDQFRNFIKKWESTSDIMLAIGTDTIYRCLDGTRLYKGFYWYRPQDELLEGEIFKELYIPDLSKTIKISNKGRVITSRGTISSGYLNKQGYVRIGIDKKNLKFTD